MAGEKWSPERRARFAKSIEARREKKTNGHANGLAAKNGNGTTKEQTAFVATGCALDARKNVESVAEMFRLDPAVLSKAVLREFSRSSRAQQGKGSRGGERRT